MDDGWAVPLANTSYGPTNTSHAQFLHDIAAWSKIAKHLWIWDCARKTIFSRLRWFCSTLILE